MNIGSLETRKQICGFIQTRSSYRNEKCANHLTVIVSGDVWWQEDKGSLQQQHYQRNVAGTKPIVCILAQFPLLVNLIASFHLSETPVLLKTAKNFTTLKFFEQIKRDKKRNSDAATETILRSSLWFIFTTFFKNCSPPSKILEKSRCKKLFDQVASPHSLKKLIWTKLKNISPKAQHPAITVHNSK